MSISKILNMSAQRTHFSQLVVVNSYKKLRLDSYQLNLWDLFHTMDIKLSICLYICWNVYYVHLIKLSYNRSCSEPLILYIFLFFFASLFSKDSIYFWMRESKEKINEIIYVTIYYGVYYFIHKIIPAIFLSWYPCWVWVYKGS